MIKLDIEAVQAFVLIADLKSFTHAAEALDTTQSAVSLKIKRLEDVLGHRLLERTPRSVRLSFDGARFLEAARVLVAAHQGAAGALEKRHSRRLVIGISHHVLGPELPVLLRRLNAAEPDVVVEIRVSESNAVLEDFDQGAIDAAVVLRHDSRRLDGVTLLKESFGWMAHADFEHRSGEPLRLAAQAAPCGVRRMAIDALDAAGIAWTEVFVGAGVATLGAAVSAGVAVAALGHRIAPPGALDVGPKFRLPPLPTRDVVLHSGQTDPQARNLMRALSAAIRSTVGIR